jgi:hypothetical protein
MPRRLRALVSFSLLPAATFLRSSACAAQQVPSQLQPPADQHLVLQVHAKGDQVYICQEGVTEFAWALKAPDAQLFDKDGKPFGK